MLLHHKLRLLLLHMMLWNVLRRRLSKLLTIWSMRLRWRLRTSSWCPRAWGITRSIRSRACDLTPTTRRPHLLHASLMLRAYTSSRPVLTLMTRASHGSRINWRWVSSGNHWTHGSSATKVGMLASLALRSSWHGHSGSHILPTRSSGSDKSSTSSHRVTPSHDRGSHARWHTWLG